MRDPYYLETSTWVLQYGHMHVGNRRRKVLLKSGRGCGPLQYENRHVGNRCLKVLLKSGRGEKRVVGGQYENMHVGNRLLCTMEIWARTEKN
jgi:hypothetical protein